MYKYNSQFNRLIDALAKSGDITLRWQFQKEMMKQRFFAESELDALADRLMPHIVSRLSATVDVSDVIKAIKELENSIDDLGR